MLHRKHTLMTAVFFLLLSSPAVARDSGVEGLIIGAGSGALVGQAVGGTAESTIIGSTVGGMLGYIIDKSDDRRHRPMQVAFYGHDGYRHRPGPPPPPQYGHRYPPPPPPPPPRVFTREFFSGGEMCRETISERHFHGRLLRDVVSTECWPRRDHYHRHGHHPQPYRPWGHRF